MKKKGGCKLVGLVTVLAMAFGIMAMAEEPAINPATVTTPRVVLYGTNPLKVGSTEITETMLKKGTTGITNAVLSTTSVTNIWTVLDASTNAVSLTNITPSVTITLTR